MTTPPAPGPSLSWARGRDLRYPPLHMRSTGFCTLAVMALGLASSGCGTTILFSYAIDQPFLRANSDHNSARPLTPPVRHSVLTLDSGPLRVVCNTVEDATQMEFTRTVSFDWGGRAVVLLAALGEAGIATALALDAKNRPTNWIPFGLVAADATGALLYAILERDKYVKKRWIGYGGPQKSQTCPPGIVLSGSGQSVPIDPSGRPEGDVGWMINAVLQMNATLSISFEGKAATWSPYGNDRCDLAKEINHPQTALYCQQVPPAAGSGQWSAPTGSWKPGRVSIEVGGSVGSP